MRRVNQHALFTLQWIWWKVPIEFNEVLWTVLYKTKHLMLLTIFLVLLKDTKVSPDFFQRFVLSKVCSLLWTLSGYFYHCSPASSLRGASEKTLTVKLATRSYFPSPSLSNSSFYYCLKFIRVFFYSFVFRYGHILFPVKSSIPILHHALSSGWGVALSRDIKPGRCFANGPRLGARQHCSNQW